MPALPISFSELHGRRPSERQLSDLIAPFKTGPTFISLAMWNLMFSLSEGNVEKYKYLQGFFIHNLIRKELRDRVQSMAALSSESARPVFGRWQLLALMKRVLLETTDEGVKDPRSDDDARRVLGDACLMMSDLLFPEDQDQRLNALAGDREGVSDELMTQWLFQFELYHPPDVYQALARNDEYFYIFDKRGEFRFGQDETLAQRFRSLTGLELRQYLRLFFSIWVLHNDLQAKHPEEINAHPTIINFDIKRIFALMDLNSEERDTFFQRVLADVPGLKVGVERDRASGRQWQFDFTTFRHFPLVYNSESKAGFTCVAYPFLIEKLASGIYHTILNSWPEKDSERVKFQGWWGKVFEQFINDRLREEFPPLSNRLYLNPYFHKKQSGSLVEVSDAVLDYGNALILLEHKGGYLNLDEKYSGDVSKLLQGIADKFGLQKATKQLSRSVGKLFSEDPSRRDTFSELDNLGHPTTVAFSVKDVARIREVYPVAIVQDFSMTIGFINRRLRLQFEQQCAKTNIDSNVHIRPLSLLTVENLEDVLEHLGEVPLTDVLDEYAKEEHSPLTTFDAIFKQLLKSRGIEQRRYRWSLRRGEEFLDSIMKQFSSTD